MPDVSPILSLPYIQPSQAQKHVTHNEALRLLDVLVQPVAISRTLATPPANPQEGDRYIVASGSLGAWAGHDGQIAFFENGTWAFLIPRTGWRVRVLAESADVVFNGTAWVGAAEGPLSVTQLGIGTAPDATNRLAVASPATLFTNVGGGHQVKVNKAAVGDTASLLFQSGFSGRAEMGLAGSDDFAIKVSPNGGAFVDALTVAAATGRVTVPQGAVVQGQITGTAVTQSATDGTAGRVLKVGDFGLGGATVPVLTNLTLAVAPGIYSFAENTATGSPGTGSFECALFVTGPAVAATGGSFIAIRRTATAASQKIWIGARATGTGAITWVELRHAANLLGTVSQSAGVPTGAVIERASNANGSYVRLADGTQICRHTLSVTNIDVASGAVFQSADAAWTFPAAFIGGPVVTGIVASDRSWLAQGSVATTATQTTVRATRSLSVTGAIQINVIATGQWF